MLKIALELFEEFNFVTEPKPKILFKAEKVRKLFFGKRYALLYHLSKRILSYVSSNIQS